MDANRLRFWMLADPIRHWKTVFGYSDTSYRDTGRRTVRLASAPPVATLEMETDPPGRLLTLGKLVHRVPGARDAFGTWASLDQTQGALMAAGAGPTPLPLLTFTPEMPESLPSDLVLGNDDVLYVATAGGKVLLKDLNNRWDPTTVTTLDFESWRLAAAPEGGVYAIEAPPSLMPASDKELRIARVTGTPLPRDLLGERAPAVFRPKQENRDPPRMTIVARATLPGEVVVGIATSPTGRLAVLSWVYSPSTAEAADDPKHQAFARLRFLLAGGLSKPISLVGARRPYSFAWLADDRLAVLLLNEYKDTGEPVSSTVATYLLMPGSTSAGALGDYYPLTGHDTGPFLHGRTLPPHYPTRSGPPAPLYPISLPSFARKAFLRNATEDGVPIIDGGNSRAVWHRLYLEASLPPRCGIHVFLAATNTPERPPDEASDVWHEHVFGNVAPASTAKHVPRGVWVKNPSELPFHPGLLTCEPEPDRRGLFTALIQRAGRRVRSLRGRYLWVRAVLVGDGRATPELAALRVYGPRFSYAEQYLPELYRESTFGAEAEAPSDASTPADFLERFLGLAEGILTPLEDRIASASLLTDPRRVPEESIEWLAGWIGLTFEPGFPPERRRRLLEAAPSLRPWRGTLRGLAIALDAVTGGAVSEGGLIIVEEFRLRRTFSTILGVNLAEEDDPMLPGLYRSGNSYVGDTLFLGDEQRKEFLSLFGEGLPATAEEREAVEQFFTLHAHRVTVLVHRALDERELGLIQRVAEQESPAHVRLEVKLASHPLMVGVAALVGIDTYLGPQSKPRPVRVGRSALGGYNVLKRPPSLDPRLQAGE
jgi:phage tail-like protein